MVIETTDRTFSDLPIPPGELLAEELEARGMTQRELAERTGRPEQAISEIINGRKAITHDTALELDKVLSIPAHVWVNLESSYQLTQARLRQRLELEKYEGWLTDFPVKELQDLEYLPKPASRQETLQALLRFFGVASFPALRHWQDALLGQYRITEGTSVRPGALWAWLRVGDLKAADLETAPYDQGRFVDVLHEIRARAREPSTELISVIETLCASAGVAFVLVKQFTGTGANGVARWLAPTKALIQMSTMRRYFDIFIFSFFHEAKHILDRDKRRVFVHGLDGDDEAERAANEFARDFLIPAEQWRQFREAEPRSYDAVRSFSAAVGVEPGVVVGRLQNEGAVPHSHLNRIRSKFTWKEEKATK